MDDKEILTGIKKYFDVRELVGKEVYEEHGVNSWQYLDIRLLHALLIVREGIGLPIYSNNWYFWKSKEKHGEYFSQRGLRSNIQSILKGKTLSDTLYLSGHVFGKADDFDVKGMSANDVRKWIVSHADLFPFKIRLENNVNWVHMDVIQDESKPKIYLFSV